MREGEKKSRRRDALGREMKISRGKVFTLVSGKGIATSLCMEKGARAHVFGCKTTSPSSLWASPQVGFHATANHSATAVAALCD